ncbi:MAG: D-aminoacylase [Candidatus Rokubacteria bacterium]|nr:D-aminoacylase [Candidatus Rokubacteria bacterium]
MLDSKIEGVTVLDGTGAPGFRTDVGVTGEAIVAVGDLSREPAGTTLRASGLTLAPGFIDIHSHSDWRLWANRRAESKIRQGVTTEVVGNCGFSPAPVNPAFREELRGFALYLPEGMDFSWQSVEEYLNRLDGGGLALNVIQLVGHGALRVAAMGFARRKPTESELAHMKRLVAESLEGGAWGMSTGLIYAPGSYAETEEIVELSRVAGRHRGFYASHIRGEGANLLNAISEAIRIGREAELPVEVSHLKAAGRPHWGQVKEALALINAARAEGLDVTADVYPYTASSTTLRTLLPGWVLEGGVEAMLQRLSDPATRGRIRAEVEAGRTGGENLAANAGWDGTMIAYAPSRPEAEGKRLSDLAREWGQAPLDVAMDLIVADRGKAYVVLFQLDEADLTVALADPHVMIGSDGSALSPHGELGRGRPHPRSYGTFPRVLARYWRDQRLLSLEQAVHKMTGLPAKKLGLKDRGVIRVGAKADLVIFNHKTVTDLATYEEPHRYPAGIEYVFVNGRLVIKAGEHTGSLPGRVLTPP